MSQDAYVREYIPTCETFGWTGGPVFSTRIITKANGRERRNADWSQPQHEYSLPFQGLTQSQYAPIKQMHLNRRGAWGVFLYRDRLDDRLDQTIFAIAAAGQSEFQLSKPSVIDGVEYQRNIVAAYQRDPGDPSGRLAIPSDLVIRVDGVIASPADYVINPDNGKITFDTPMAGSEILDATGPFSIWVRFVSDKLPFTIINKGAKGFFVEGTIDLLEMPAPVELDSASS